MMLTAMRCSRSAAGEVRPPVCHLTPAGGMQVEGWASPPVLSLLFSFPSPTPHACTYGQIDVCPV